MQAAALLNAVKGAPGAAMASMAEQGSPGTQLVDLLMDQWERIKSGAKDRYGALERAYDELGPFGAILNLAGPLSPVRVDVPERDKRQRMLED